MKAYCINLKIRRHKWLKAQVEAEKLDIELIRFDAIFNKDGHAGCMDSHIALLEQIEEDVFMIVEDDIKTIGTREQLDESISQLPDDWDMLYLGAQLSKPIKRYSENLYRLKGGKVTHAILYNNQHGIVDYIIEHRKKPIDAFYAEQVQEEFNCFITYPMICIQADGHSDTTHWHKRYASMQENYKMNTKDMQIK